MKYILLSVLAFSSFTGLAQSTLILTDPISVANGDEYGETRPRIALNGSGEPIVAWGMNSTDRLFVSSWNSASNGFSTPVQVNTSGVNAFISNWVGPDIGFYGDTAFVVYHSTPVETGHVYVHKSVDGGLTFGDSVRVDGPTVDQSRYPSITVTPQGNPVVSFMSFEGNYIDPGYVVANSTDGGATFMQDVEGSWDAPGEVCDCCPAQVATSNGKQALVFRNNDDNLRDNWVSISADGGVSFPITLDVDDNSWMVNSCPSSGPDVIMNNDSIYTTWMSKGSGDFRIFISSISTETGAIGHSGLVREIPFDGTTENFPRIAGDGQNIGIVYQAWRMGETDCHLTVSQNGIVGLGDTLLLGGTADGTQRNPDVAYANGAYHIVYEDNGTGDLMYQMAYFGNVGIESPTIDADVWSAATGNLEIRLSDQENYTVDLVNNLGQTILSKKTSGSSLSLNHLPKGVVHVRIFNAEKSSERSVFIK